jgi:superfamily II DNA/RNA helicase
MDLEKILAKLKIKELNAMQQAAMQAVGESDHDIVILSATGSGKTLAYLLPLIQLVDADSDDVQAVVLVPGRELALQSDTVLKNTGSGLRSCCCYGGRAAMDEHRKIKEQHPQIVFATPGRLNDHLKKENISPYTIRYIIIDEFDKCLEMGFRDEMSDIISRLKGAQRHILLSATDAEEIPGFVNMKKTTRLDYLDKTEQVPDRVKLYEVISPEKDKLDTLQQLLRSFGDQSTIVFLNYRDGVERTEEYLRKRGFSTSLFHGGLDQKLREDALYKFSNGSTNIFVFYRPRIPWTRYPRYRQYRTLPSAAERRKLYTQGRAYRPLGSPRQGLLRARSRRDDARLYQCRCGNLRDARRTA